MDVAVIADASGDGCPARIGFRHHAARFLSSGVATKTEFREDFGVSRASHLLDYVARREADVVPKPTRPASRWPLTRMT